MWTLAIDNEEGRIELKVAPLVQVEHERSTSARVRDHQQLSCVLCLGMRTACTSQCPVRVWETLPATCSALSSFTGETLRLIPPPITSLAALTAPLLFSSKQA